jgi:hypothetical protein
VLLHNHPGGWCVPILLAAIPAATGWRKWPLVRPTAVAAAPGAADGESSELLARQRPSLFYALFRTVVRRHGTMFANKPFSAGDIITPPEIV